MNVSKLDIIKICCEAIKNYLDGDKFAANNALNNYERGRK